MSVSLQTQLTKGSYFITDTRVVLYYIVDRLPDEDFYLVENCYTNECKWVPAEKLFQSEREEVIPRKC